MHKAACVTASGMHFRHQNHLPVVQEHLTCEAHVKRITCLVLQETSL